MDGKVENNIEKIEEKKSEENLESEKEDEKEEIQLNILQESDNEKVEREILDDNELQSSRNDIEIVNEESGEEEEVSEQVELKKEQPFEEEIEATESIEGENEEIREPKEIELEDDEILTNEPNTLFTSTGERGFNEIPFSPIPSNHSSFTNFQESSEISFKQIFVEIEALKKHVQSDTFKIANLESQISTLQTETKELKKKNV